ncbi:hypothetical protein ACS0TY_032130 [Phlomoides rotata]
MEANKEQGKRIMEVSEYDDEGEEDEEVGDDNKKKGALTPSKRRVAGAGGSSTQRSCQVEDCTADMTDVKPYHRRHKVCEYHAKAAVVLLSGIRQRFCQQCSSLKLMVIFSRVHISYHGHFSFSHNLGPDRGFMNYQNLMKLKEVVAGVLRDTMSDAARAHMILIEKRCNEIMSFP